MSEWKDALAPTPECIDIIRLGETLTDAERAHLATCTRCQSELALFHEIQREETSTDEDAAARWIADELRRRNNVIALSGGAAAASAADGAHASASAPEAAAAPPVTIAFRPNAWRVLYAVAAALVMIIGAGWWMQMREPSIDATIGDDVYRSARLEIIAPAGDLAQAPNELRWRSVPNASRYHVRILEVDRAEVWRSETTRPQVALPPAVIAQFNPGKRLLWEVQAFRGTEMLASSETQSVRVSVAPLRKDR